MLLLYKTHLIEFKLKKKLHQIMKELSLFFNMKIKCQNLISKNYQNKVINIEFIGVFGKYMIIASCLNDD